MWVNLRAEACGSDDGCSAVMLSSQVVFQQSVPDLTQSLVLDLSDAFFGNADDGTDLCERLGFFARRSRPAYREPFHDYPALDVAESRAAT